MRHSSIGILGDRLVRIRIEVRAGPVVLAEDATERVSRHHEAAGSMGGSAQFPSAVEAALVPVHAKSEDVPHIGIGFHGADEHDVVLGGERGKFVAVPGSSVFGDAQASQSQAFCLKDEIFGGKAGIRAAFGRMDV
jgi:hypothetical protein